MYDEKVYTVNDINDISDLLLRICDNEIPVRISMVQLSTPARTDILRVDCARQRFYLREFNGLESLLEEVKKISLMANIRGLSVDMRSCEFKAWVETLDTGQRVAMFSFPSSIVRTDSRSTFRAQVLSSYDLSAELVLGGSAGSDRVQAKIDDISVTGLRLRFPEMTKMPWQKSETGQPERPVLPLTLRYQDDNEREQIIEIDLQVRWYRLMSLKKNTPPQFCVGGEFVNLNGDHGVELSRLVVDVQLAERRMQQERR